MVRLRAYLVGLSVPFQELKEISASSYCFPPCVRFVRLSCSIVDSKTLFYHMDRIIGLLM